MTNSDILNINNYCDRKLKMLENDLFDGFSVILERENNSWKAYFVELPTIYGVSSSSIEAIIRTKIKWEEFKEECKKIGKELPLPVLEKNYSGRFNVRLDETLHKALTNEAIQNNISLNALINRKLRQSTVTEKRSYQWKLDKVAFYAMRNSILLSFSCDEKSMGNRVTLEFFQGNLGDILGDSKVYSEADLEKCINSEPNLNDAFQKFIQEQHYNGFVERGKIIDCVLVSTEEVRRVMHYISEDLEEKFPKKGNFYITRINR